jgi:hypothetical protein
MRITYHLTTVAIGLGVCLSTSSAQVTEDNAAPAITIEQINGAWQTQTNAVPEFELVLAEMVDIPQARLDRLAESALFAGRGFRPYPNHRLEVTRLIVRNERMFMEHEMVLPDRPRNHKATYFFDGKETYYLRESSPPGEDREANKVSRLGSIREGLPTQIVALLSLKPIFLALRGSDAPISRLDFDNYQVTKQDEKNVTLQGDRGKELVLDRDRGFAPVQYRGPDWEIKIDYTDGDGPPYVPNRWSFSSFHPEGDSTTVIQRVSFSLLPTIDLATYRLTFPEGTYVIAPDDNNAAPARIPQDPTGSESATSTNGREDRGKERGQEKKGVRSLFSAVGRGNCLPSGG